MPGGGVDAQYGRRAGNGMKNLMGSRDRSASMASRAGDSLNSWLAAFDISTQKTGRVFFPIISDKLFAGEPLFIQIYVSTGMSISIKEWECPFLVDHPSIKLSRGRARSIFHFHPFINRKGKYLPVLSFVHWAFPREWVIGNNQIVRQDNRDVNKVLKSRDGTA